MVLLLAAVLAAAALLGKVRKPRGMSDDVRLSTRLTTPSGASAFRSALGRLGVNVTERRTALFHLDDLPVDPGVLFAILSPAGQLTVPESRGIRDWVAGGGQLLLAGHTGAESCFGYVVIRTGDPTPLGRGPLVGRQASGETRTDRVPAPRAIVRRIETDDKVQTLDARRCEPLPVPRAERLWFAAKQPSAILLRYPSGGTVTLVADAGVFSNQALRNTDAGALVFHWILSRRPRAVIVDEYHQGFGRAGSLPGAVMARIWREPSGWLVLQLAAAGLLLVVLGAIRFGPALPAIERRRRSPLEHLDALASGLERSRASRTGIGLIVSGLRRRLGGLATHPGRDAAWLDALTEGARSQGSRAALERLRGVARGAGHADIMQAANAVEEVWETLKVPTRTQS